MKKKKVVICKLGVVPRSPVPNSAQRMCRRFFRPVSCGIVKSNNRTVFKEIPGTWYGTLNCGRGSCNSGRVVEHGISETPRIKTLSIPLNTRSYCVRNQSWHSWNCGASAGRWHLLCSVFVEGCVVQRRDSCIP